MIKKTLFLIFFSILSIAAIDGNLFPSIQGETLEGKQVNIPQTTMGKVTIVGMAYSKKSEDMLSSWLQPMYDKFIAKSGMFDDYDVNLYFIPMFTGTKKMAYNKTIKNLKAGNHKDLHPYMMFYKGELEPYVTDLKMDRKDLPYFFVLDKKGNIVYSTKGFYSEAKMEKIEEAIDNN